MFSVRAVVLDHYSTKPIDELEEENQVLSKHWQVPVIRIFGSTPDGLKCCVHVHGVYPYIYVPYVGGDNAERDALLLGAALDEALKINSNQKNIRFVFDVSQYTGTPLYGYHSKPKRFFKVLFNNPFYIRKASELLLSGAILNQKFQPHEAHIPFVLQFMMDYKIYGMSFVNFSKVKYRRNPDNPELLKNVPVEDILPGKIQKSTTCCLEVDVLARDIVQETYREGARANPGLQAIWEDEMARRRAQNKISQITAPNTQSRPKMEIGLTELMYKERLSKALEKYKLQEPEVESLPVPSSSFESFSNGKELVDETVLSLIPEANDEDEKSEDEEERFEADSVLGRGCGGDEKEEEEQEEEDGRLDMTQPLELDERIWELEEIRSQPESSRGDSEDEFWKGMADQVFQLDGAQDSSSESDPEIMFRKVSDHSPTSDSSTASDMDQKQLESDLDASDWSTNIMSILSEDSGCPTPSTICQTPQSFWSSFSPKMDSWLSNSTDFWNKGDNFYLESGKILETPEINGGNPYELDVNMISEVEKNSFNPSWKNSFNSTPEIINDGFPNLELSEFPKKNTLDEKINHEESKKTETTNKVLEEEEKKLLNILKNFSSEKIGGYEKKTVSLTLKQYIKDCSEIINVDFKNLCNREMVIIEYKPVSRKSKDNKFLIKPLDKFLNHWNTAEKKLNNRLWKNNEKNSLWPKVLNGCKPKTEESIKEFNIKSCERNYSTNVWKISEDINTYEVNENVFSQGKIKMKLTKSQSDVSKQDFIENYEIKNKILIFDSNIPEQKQPKQSNRLEDTELINKINTKFEEYFKKIVKNNNRPEKKEDVRNLKNLYLKKKLKDKRKRKRKEDGFNGDPVKLVSKFLYTFSKMTEMPSMSVTINLGNSGESKTPPVYLNLGSNTVFKKNISKKIRKKKTEIENVDGAVDSSSEDSLDSDCKLSNFAQKKLKRDGFYKPLNVILGSGSLNLKESTGSSSKKKTSSQNITTPKAEDNFVTCRRKLQTSQIISKKEEFGGECSRQTEKSNKKLITPRKSLGREKKKIEIKDSKIEGDTIIFDSGGEEEMDILLKKRKRKKRQLVRKVKKSTKAKVDLPKMEECPKVTVQKLETSENKEVAKSPVEVNLEQLSNASSKSLISSKSSESESSNSKQDCFNLGIVSSGNVSVVKEKTSFSISQGCVQKEEASFFISQDSIQKEAPLSISQGSVQKEAPFSISQGTIQKEEPFSISQGSIQKEAPFSISQDSIQKEEVLTHLPLSGSPLFGSSNSQNLDEVSGKIGETPPLELLHSGDEKLISGPSEKEKTDSNESTWRGGIELAKSDSQKYENLEKILEVSQVFGSKTIKPKIKPITKQEAAELLARRGVVVTLGKAPFYGNPKDLTKAVESGPRVLKVDNDSIAGLKTHKSEIELMGTEERRNNLIPQGNKQRCSLVSQNLVNIVPLNKPPSKISVLNWWKGLKEKKAEGEEKTKIKVVKPLSPGQDSDSDAEMDLSLSASICIESCDKKSDPGNVLSPILEEENVNISKEKLNSNKSNSGGSGSDELVPQVARRSSDNSFQIKGATCNNTLGFSGSIENLKNVKVNESYQHVTTLNMELHIQTRRDLRPDPSQDPIRALFYAVTFDNPNQDQENGVVVVGDNVFMKSALNAAKIHYVSTEGELFDKILELIKIWDPDILSGYEIEMNSWGFLIQRGFVLEKNLFLLLSRVIEHPTSKKSLDLLEENDEFDNAPRSVRHMRIPGRIVLDIWRVLRHEIALTSYTFENVMYHLCHERHPVLSYQKLSFFWEHPTSRFRYIVVDYYMNRVVGTLTLLDQLDFVNRTSELSRLFGIQFYEVLSRGSQYRVESMMLRLAKPLNYVPASPSVAQRASMRAPASLPLILEPESVFYPDPVIVLDFQSLYPSMIIAYNYCFSTCLGRVEKLGGRQPFEFGCTELQISPEELKSLENDINISPAGVAFVKSNIRRGVLPAMLEEILETRLMVKKSMKENKENKILQKVLFARQLGLKLIANVTYGYTAANFSGRMPCIEVGDSVVSKGRETLERAIQLVKNNTRWNAKVVYGDTDSLFVLTPGRTKEEAFEIGAEIAEAVTRDNPKPVKLKLEKVYQPCILQTKKRYLGYMFETPNQEKPVFEAKGIETVRRDGCPATAKILQKAIQILFDTRDVSQVKKYTVRQFTKLFKGTVNIQDLIFAKEYRGRKGYRPGACVPALELAKQWTQYDKRAEPRTKERVPYVIVNGPPGVPLIRLVRSPNDLLSDSSLRINAVYYITKAIIPPMQRCFSLLGADVMSWYLEMPRKFHKLYKPKMAEPQKRNTLSQYFSTAECVVCSNVTKNPLCDDCIKQPQTVVVHVNDKIRRLERCYNEILKICQSCCGRTTEVDCQSLDCPVLFRRHQAFRDLEQEPFLRDVISQYF